MSGIACSPLSLVFSLGSDLLGLLAHAREQANAVACRVCEESEPAHIGDLGLRLQRLATKRLSLGKSGVDVVGGDVNEQFTGLVGGIFTYFDEATGYSFVVASQSLGVQAGHVDRPNGSPRR